MTTYTLHREQFIPLPREFVFPFFADAGNLERITPPFLQFSILTPRPIDMRAGALIDYRIRLRGLPIRWRTLISTWQPPFRFVDEQVKGPYLLWRHEHTFEPAPGGTRCTDRVDYRIPGGPLAPILHRLIVRRDLERIFDYRARALADVFAQDRPADAVVKTSDPHEAHTPGPSAPAP
ncbi:MAG: SRPBCC family protein [Phycisphaeraceae bacterium]|nr:MAG: SRPBCC family protein [Phycisphaeraceae bacterium]